MSDRQRCQCSPSCNFTAAEGSTFYGLHDPARAEENRAVLAARGRLGGVKQGENRTAVKEESAADAGLDSIEKQLDALTRALRRVLGAPIDAAKVAAAVAQLVKVARDVLTASELEQENRELRAIIESNPDLKRKLKSVP